MYNIGFPPFSPLSCALNVRSRQFAQAEPARAFGLHFSKPQVTIKPSKIRVLSAPSGVYFRVKVLIIAAGLGIWVFLQSQFTRATSRTLPPVRSASPSTKPPHTPKIGRAHV